MPRCAALVPATRAFSSATLYSTRCSFPEQSDLVAPTEAIASQRAVSGPGCCASVAERTRILGVIGGCLPVTPIGTFVASDGTADTECAHADGGSSVGVACTLELAPSLSPAPSDESAGALPPSGVLLRRGLPIPTETHDFQSEYVPLAVGYS